jgi:DNA-binding transcriptional LysR family regulator
MNRYHSDVNDKPADPAVPGAFDWGLLQVFLAVDEAGSLGRAAANLGSSQPTVSRRLADLEAALGQPLFERSRRGVRLTAAGAALREPALRMRDAAAGVRRAADHHARSLAGSVRITASEIVGHFVLPPLLLALRRAQPQIQIDLVPTDAIEDLIERRADIAIRMARPTEPSLIARRLPDMPLGLYAHRDYLARRGMPTRATMAAHEWIGYDRDDRMLRGFAAAGQPVTREFFVLRSDSSALQWHAACAGLGIAAVLDRVAAVTPGMRRVMPEVAMPSLPVWLVVHRELRGSPRLRAVFDALAAMLAESPPASPPTSSRSPGPPSASPAPTTARRKRGAA